MRPAAATHHGNTTSGEGIASMRYRQLGISGLTVSVVGLGCNNFGSRCDLEQTRAVVDAALEQGITLLDTADAYGNRGGSETFLGEILKGRRDQVALATKFGSPMGGPEEEARGSRRYIRHAVEASLRRLQTDWIDLYQHHRPDPRTPLEETVAALAAQPAVASVIAGATRPEQVVANVEAAEWQPTPEDLAALDTVIPRGSSTPR
jgi:aryl-alcohol dehydrogenase-like predicted oxidoreductase